MGGVSCAQSVDMTGNIYALQVGLPAHMKSKFEEERGARPKVADGSAASPASHFSVASRGGAKQVLHSSIISQRQVQREFLKVTSKI